jgi:hypothetical protein
VNHPDTDYPSMSDWDLIHLFEGLIRELSIRYVAEYDAHLIEVGKEMVRRNIWESKK